jgi:hypothetical protein
VGLTAQWRTSDQSDTILIVDDEDNTVRQAISADPKILSRFLTDAGDLRRWPGQTVEEAGRRSPDAWGELVIARAGTGEVITMDPRLFWEGIYTWFRSKGVDYDSAYGAEGV